MIFGSRKIIPSGDKYILQSIIF